MCAEAGGSMTLYLTSERDSLSRKRKEKILVTGYTITVHYFMTLTITDLI